MADDLRDCCMTKHHTAVAPWRCSCDCHASKPAMVDETRLMLTAQECATLFESQTHKHFGENWLCHKDGTSADCETPIVRASLEVAFARGVAAGVEQNGLRFQAAIKEALERPRTPSWGIHSSTALANLGDCVVCAYATGRDEQRTADVVAMRAWATENDHHPAAPLLRGIANVIEAQSDAIEKESTCGEGCVCEKHFV
jgi:hypothetical protein